VNAKHTPGPWTIERHFHPEEAAIPSYLEIVAEARGECRYLCQILPQFEERPTDETLSNARLIAAAPDLLVACQAVLPALEWCHAQGLQTSGALEIVRAAIAKAKGE
jgi:hypothetical protein